MPVERALALGILQGLTEFLPISSSGHLVLVPWLLGWAAPGLTFSVAVHWGTLAAVIVYFRRDWVELLRGGIHALGRRDLDDRDGHLLLMILIGTIPAGLAGLLLEDYLSAAFSTPGPVAANLLVTAAMLTAAEYLANSRDSEASYGRRSIDMASIGVREALFIGMAQAFAILPGISRSGVTIAAGLGAGLSRQAAARYSFLLATPVIFAAGVLQAKELALSGISAEEWEAILIGMIGAGSAGYLAVEWLMRFLTEGKLLGFAVYCALFGSSAFILSSVR